MADKELTKKQDQEVTRRENGREDYFIPAADIWETENDIRLKLDVPGVAKDDLSINIDGNTMTIHAKVSEKPAGAALYSEKEFADYRRQFTLSDDLDYDNIKAQIKDGVLDLTVAKAPTAKPRKIEISAS